MNNVFSSELALYVLLRVKIRCERQAHDFSMLAKRTRLTLHFSHCSSQRL